MKMQKHPLNKGVLTHNASLKMLNSWHVGGNADQTYEPADLDDLSLFLQSLPADEPITWLGLGSNVLIRDGGIRGTVILTQGALNELSLVVGAPHEAPCLYVQAGVTCAKVAKFATKHNLVGAEFYAGIPGTMGGALAMNAGAFGGETWDTVAEVQLIDRSGNITWHPRVDFETGYRTVNRPQNTWFVGARLQLTTGDAVESAERIKALLKKRSETQPIGLPSCGSVFRNPPGDHAARLIESCGLKGMTIGGAQVSTKHANFIINTGSASSDDLEQLISHVASTVQAKTGIILHREVLFLGDRSTSA
jgi:UDP-N-acetylmuramate dehydrogenase